MRMNLSTKTLPRQRGIKRGSNFLNLWRIKIGRSTPSKRWCMQILLRKAYSFWKHKDTTSFKKSLIKRILLSKKKFKKILTEFWESNFPRHNQIHREAMPSPIYTCKQWHLRFKGKSIIKIDKKEKKKGRNKDKNKSWRIKNSKKGGQNKC